MNNMLKTKNLVNKSINLEHIKIKYDIQKFSRKKVYHLHNSYHLGDNVFNLILFNIIKKYIEANNIKIFYYAKNEYISQLSEFICSKNIILNSLNNKPQNSLEVWICNDFYNYVHGPKYFTISYNKYYINFFNIVLRNLNINCSINKFYYVDDNLKSRYERLSPKYKGFDILKKTLRQINNKNLKLVIFGENKKIKFSELDTQVIDIGFVKKNEELKYLYSAADATIIPSRIESFGQMASESSACGTPVIAFRTGGLKDIVEHKITGYLAKNFESEDLANGINWILSSKNKKKISQNARKRIINNFDNYKIAKKYLKVYCENIVSKIDLSK